MRPRAGSGLERDGQRGSEGRHSLAPHHSPGRGPDAAAMSWARSEGALTPRAQGPAPPWAVAGTPLAGPGRGPHAGPARVSAQWGQGSWDRSGSGLLFSMQRLITGFVLCLFLRSTALTVAITNEKCASWGLTKSKDPYSVPLHKVQSYLNLTRY